MTDFLRRFRGPGIALVVLALSAGVVFAGAPRISLVGDTETVVEEPGGEVDTKAPDAEEPTATDEDEDEDENKDAEDGDTDAAGAPDGTHGALVSDAAGMDTPAGFRNHGAFVSCVARSDKDAVEPLDPATLTPEDCGLTPTPAPDAAADADAATGKAKGEAKAQAGKAKGEAKAQAGKAKGKAKSGR